MVSTFNEGPRPCDGQEDRADPRKDQKFESANEEIDRPGSKHLRTRPESLPERLH
jgi:hypothetical protein